MSTNTDFSRHMWTWPGCMERRTHEFQALVIDSNRNTIALRKDGENFLLPGCLIDYKEFESSCEPWYLIPLVGNILGIKSSLVFRRLVWAETRPVKTEDVNHTLERFVAFLEFHGDLQLRKEYQWVPLQHAKVCHESVAASTAIDLELACALNTSEPPNRCSWQRQGWFKRSSEWMVSVLERFRMASLSESVIQMRSSVLSAILRAETNGGRFFLKCTSPTANDASYTKVLARIAPQFVPEPVAVDESRQLMVTADYGEILNTFDLSKQERRRLSKDYAQLQKATTGRCNELVQAGFPDFRPTKLCAIIDELAADPMFKALASSQLENMSCSVGDEVNVGDEVSFFLGNTARFKEGLQRLETSGMPPTVHHNDLLLSNIYKPDSSDHYMFFDWVEGFVSHPFVGCRQGIVADCYLVEWVSYGSREQLCELLQLGAKFFDLARFVVHLKEATSWEQPDAAESREEACNRLQAFNDSFRD